MKPHLNNEAGFTLIEALVALMVSSLVIVFLTGSILQIKKINDVFISDAQSPEESSNMIINDRQMEFHIFLNQFELYLQGTVKPVIGDSQMQVSEWNSNTKRFFTTTYRRPGSNTRNFTRVKNGGNHRMLTEVRNILMERNGGWLSVQVRFLNGEIYKGRIWVESWTEEVEEE